MIAKRAIMMLVRRVEWMKLAPVDTADTSRICYSQSVYSPTSASQALALEKLQLLLQGPAFSIAA